MVKCAKCTKVVTKKNPGLQCSKCNKWLHGVCSSLTTEQLSALSATESVDWKCRNCIGTKPKRISCILPNPEEDDSDQEGGGMFSVPDKDAILAIFRQETREIIKQELQTTLDFYSRKIDDYEQKMKDYESRVKLVENQCKDLQNVIKNINLQNDVLEQKVNKMEQAYAQNNIEICGVKEKEGENAMTIALSICQKLKQKSEDIIRVYRKKKPADRSTGQSTKVTTPVPAPIIVSLRDKGRDCWLEAAKNMTLTTRDIGEESDEKVTIRESLSPTTAFLLWKTKSLLKDKFACKYVWCKNGLILVRKQEGDKKVYTVRSNSDIARIVKELQNK